MAPKKKKDPKKKKKDPNNTNNREVWKFRPLKYNWDDLTAAADSLQAKEDEQGNYTLSIKNSRRQYQPLSPNARLARTALIQISKDRKLASRITEEDVEHFNHWMHNAEQELELYRYYFFCDTATIKHDSSAEDVMEDIQSKGFNLNRDWLVRSLVEDLIWGAQAWHGIDLKHQYALFLPECDFIHCNANPDACLEQLKADQRFKDKQFDEMSDWDLEDGLSCYLEHLRLHASSRNPKLGYKKEINDEYKFGIGPSRMERRKRLPGLFSTPIHFLVYRKNVEKHNLQHPVLEINKIRLYFDKYLGELVPFRRSEADVPSDEGGPSGKPSRGRKRIRT